MEHRIVFNGPIYETQTNALRDVIANVLARPDCAAAKLIFNSEGGNTDQGHSLYAFFRSLHRPIELYAAGHVGSIAVPAFLGAAKRTAAPHARFFFHGYDWTFAPNQTPARIEEAIERLKHDIAMSRQIVEQNTTIPPETLNNVYAHAPSPMIVEPEQALGFGIIQSIYEMNAAGAAQPDVAVWTVNWPK